MHAVLPLKAKIAILIKPSRTFLISFSLFLLLQMLVTFALAYMLQNNIVIIDSFSSDFIDTRVDAFATMRIFDDAALFSVWLLTAGLTYVLVTTFFSMISEVKGDVDQALHFVNPEQNSATRTFLATLLEHGLFVFLASCLFFAGQVTIAYIYRPFSDLLFEFFTQPAIEQLIPIAMYVVCLIIPTHGLVVLLRLMNSNDYL